ncbi:MAG: class I SAM-dependent methyltransferase [Bryobacteraceae bacterium]
MGFYDRHILPRVIDVAMRQQRLEPYRRRVLAGAEGRVLEIGVGSGPNLPFYPKQATEILGLEPHTKLQAMAARAGVQVVPGSAEAIPLDRASVDTVVTTWTLCSISGIEAALVEMRRVLRPGGKLLFVEHGLAPDAGVQKWQHRLTPMWKGIAGGCHLDRDIPALIRAAGFEIVQMDTGHMPGPRPMTFMYEGWARPL